MDEIFSRVSIRKYLEKPVEEEKIDRIMRAAMAAPSACNQQPWEFYVVTDKEKIEKLSKASPYAGCAAKAPLIIVPCYRIQGLAAPEFDKIDLSIATENILLEITAQGLGGVWLAVAPIQERMNAVEEILGMDSEKLHAFALVAAGYAAEDRKPQNRYDEARIHYVR